MRYHEIMNLHEDVAQAPSSGPSDDQGFFDPQDDAIEHQDLGDTRKPKLTLRMVNRLKKIRSTKNLEMIKKQDLLGIMYGQGGEEEA